MKQNDIISIIQDNDISEYYSLKNLGIEGYAFPYQEALKIVQICKFLVIPILGGDVYSMNLLAELKNRLKISIFLWRKSCASR